MLESDCEVVCKYVLPESLLVVFSVEEQQIDL